MSGGVLNCSSDLIGVAEACPDMAIYKPQLDQPLKEALPGNYYPASRRLDVTFGNSKHAYLQSLQAFLNERGGSKPDETTLVTLEPTLWDVDTRSLPSGLRKNFGQLLRINPR